MDHYCGTCYSRSIIIDPFVRRPDHILVDVRHFCEEAKCQICDILRKCDGCRNLFCSGCREFVCCEECYSCKNCICQCQFCGLKVGCGCNIYSCENIPACGYAMCANCRVKCYGCGGDICVDCSERNICFECARY